MTHTTEISLELLSPNPTTGQTPFTAPGMGIRDVMQGGHVQQPGLPSSPGGGGRSGQLAPLL